MKNTILGIAIILLSFGCTNNITIEDNAQLVNAELLGLDKALCPCCGSWLIKIEGEDETYQFISLPENTDIDLETSVFPLQVKLDYTKDETLSCNNYVIIEDIQLIE